MRDFASSWWRARSAFVSAFMLQANRSPPSGPGTSGTSAQRGRSSRSDIRRLPAVLLDPVTDLRESFTDHLRRRGVREADVLTLALDARTEMDVGEDGDPGLAQQALAELLGVRHAGHAAELRHVGPHVERSARRP